MSAPGLSAGCVSKTGPGLMNLIPRPPVRGPIPANFHSSLTVDVLMEGGIRMHNEVVSESAYIPATSTRDGIGTKLVACKQRPAFHQSIDSSLIFAASE